MKICILSDPHIGKKFTYGIEENISIRTWDICDTFRKILLHESEEPTLFLVAGDFLDKKRLNIAIKEYLDSLCYKLLQRKSAMIIIGGNHDMPQRREKSCFLNQFDLFPNVIVLRDICVIDPLNPSEPIKPIAKAFKLWEQINHLTRKWFQRYVFPALTEQSVSIVTFPFYMPKTYLTDYVIPIQNLKNLSAHDMKQLEARYSRSVLQEFIYEHIIVPIQKQLQTREYKHRIMVGHYQLEGSTFSNNQTFTTGEITFTKKMVMPEFFTCVAFGHIHKKQYMWDLPHVIQLGSIERMDFGERTDEKSYFYYDPATTELIEHSLTYSKYDPDRPIQIRNMFQKTYTFTDVPSEFENHILALFQHDTQDIAHLDEMLVKLVIEVPDISILDTKVLVKKLSEHVYYPLIKIKRKFTREVTLEKKVDKKMETNEIITEFIHQMNDVSTHEQEELTKKALEIIEQMEASK